MTPSARTPTRSRGSLAGSGARPPGGKADEMTGCRKTGVLRQLASGTRRYRRFSIGQRLKDSVEKQKTYFSFSRLAGHR